MSEKIKLPKYFSNKINFTDDCWIWTAYKTKNGYGQYSLKRKSFKAHRFSWECFNGIIPNGLNVLHKCDVRSCVNPDHLFLGTHKDNSDDMISKGRQVHQKCEQHWNSKLTQSDVDEIRRIYKRGTSGEFSQKGIAERYGVVQTVIGRILNHVIWKTNEGVNA